MGEPVHVSVVPWEMGELAGSVSNLPVINVTANSQGPAVLYAERPV